jgi:predicted nucleotidyltransferase
MEIEKNRNFSTREKKIRVSVVMSEEASSSSAASSSSPHTSSTGERRIESTNRGGKKGKRRWKKKEKGKGVDKNLEFIDVLTPGTLDSFIETTLANKEIEAVKTLDLSRQSLTEISPRVRFYMRMLGKLERLNLYCNKIRTLPAEMGMSIYLSINGFFFF